MALNDCAYYSSSITPSYSSRNYLTSSSPIIKSHPSKNANLFAESGTLPSYKSDFKSNFSSKQYNDSNYTSFRLTDKYYKPSTTKKSCQISSPMSITSKYFPSYRGSSSPSGTYQSRTVDSKVLDGNANYRTNPDTDSSFTLPERKLTRSDFGSRKYLPDSLTNGYNTNDIGKNKDAEDKKDYLSGTYRKRVGCDSADEGSSKWAGLRNIGNTCFMNSILQCLSCTKLLKEYVMSRSYAKDINQEGKLINAFSNLITKIWSSSSAVDVSMFKDIFQRLAPQFAGYEQHDAQEFLRFLVDKLHTDVNRVHTKPKNLPELNDNLSDSALASEHWKRYLMSENSYILDLFCGQLKSTLECLVCGNKSVTFEIFWDVSLPLPAACSSYNSSISINNILTSFTQEEILDNREKPKCSRCKIEQRMAKSYKFQKLPKYLVLHLKRFQTTSSYRKLSSVVQFPLTDLDMSPFLAKTVGSTPKLYNLYAVSNHVGTPFSGHYTANCKHPNCADWYTCNDSSVSKIASPVTPKIVNAESYILFYEAVDG